MDIAQFCSQIQFIYRKLQNIICVRLTYYCYYRQVKTEATGSIHNRNGQITGQITS